MSSLSMVLRNEHSRGAEAHVRVSMGLLSDASWVYCQSIIEKRRRYPMRWNSAGIRPTSAYPQRGFWFPASEQLPPHDGQGFLRVAVMHVSGEQENAGYRDSRFYRWQRGGYAEMNPQPAWWMSGLRKIKNINGETI